MSRKKMSEKGALPPKVVVTLFILVAGFVIILLFYKVINFEGMSDEEVCHASVIARGTAPAALGIQGRVPLNCQTQKICVRGEKFFDKGECEEFQNVKDVVYVDVNSLEEVEKFLADETLSCWNIVGQGKISLFSQSSSAELGFGGITSNCLICSRIAFDEKTLLEKRINLKEENTLDYMKTHKIPGSEETYYNRISGGDSQLKLNDLSNIEVYDSSTGQKIEANLNNLENTATNPMDETAILFMQVSAPSVGGVLQNTFYKMGITGAGAHFVTRGASTGLLKSVGKACSSSTYSAAACGAVVVAVAGVQTGVTLNNQGIAATYCGDVLAGDEARRGCSVVRREKYDIGSIRNVCGVIESIP